MVAAFYERDRGAFVASPLTRGPWSEHAQHAGPPGALLVRAIEAELPADFRLARLTLDIVRPVPIGRMEPRVEVRLGRRVGRARVVLEADGVELMVGSAVLQLTTPLDLDPVDPAERPPLDPPEAGERIPFFPVPWDEGYHTAMTWSFVRGSWTDLGPSQVWLAQTVPLVAGEEPSPAQRTVVVADAGNGVSAAVDFARFSFVNSDLSLHLVRDPVGEWIGLDAATAIQPTGAGLATTVIHDRGGPIGTGNQSLVVARQQRADS